MSDPPPTVSLELEAEDADREIVESLSKHFSGLVDSIRDEDTISDDAFLQVLNDASAECDAYDIPREEKPVYIVPAVRLALLRDINRDIGGIEQNIIMMYGL